MFALALRWGRKQRRRDPRRTHPSLIFDALPHGGASQAHPHLHAILGSGRYPGQFGAIHQATKRRKGVVSRTTRNSQTYLYFPL